MHVCYITHNVTQLLPFKKSLCTKAFQSIGVKNPVFSGFFVTYRNLTNPETRAGPGPKPLVLKGFSPGVKVLMYQGFSARP